MKKFLIIFFAVIGVLVTLLIAGAVTFAVKQQNHAENALPDEMVLNLRIEDSLHETAEPASILNPFAQTPLTIQQIVQSVDQATHDDRVKALTVYLKGGQYGLAELQEVRAAVVRFRSTGKLTLLFADTLGDGPAMGSYYFASAFSQIWLQPIGELAITGIRVDMPFGRALMDKVGVEPQILHRGRYKSYPESLMRNEMSADNREMTTGLLNDLYGQLTTTIAASRNMTVPQLQTLIDEAPVSADRALISGLIDSVGYRDDIDFYLEQTLPDAENIDLAEYVQDSAAERKTERHHKPSILGYVTIEGTLMDVDAEDGLFGSGVASAEASADAIDEASNNPHVRALVVRVNSPGGSPIAAEIIRRAIAQAADRMPVIISMGDAAASGGYWLSTAATKIVAQPATLTGSIGVFGGKMSLEKLWEKLGVNWQSIAIGKQAGIWSPHHPYSDKERTALERSLNNIYNNFIQRVAIGRHMSVDKVLAIAEGHVWTGHQALQNGLVDALGGVDTAVAVARQEADIKPATQIRLVHFPEEQSTVTQLLKMVRHRFGGSEAQMTQFQIMSQLSGITGISNGALLPLLQPDDYSTYSFVRVR